MIPHLPHPRKILNFKVRNLIVVNKNLDSNLPPEIHIQESIHKRILLAQIQELRNELGRN